MKNTVKRTVLFVGLVIVILIFSAVFCSAASAKRNKDINKYARFVSVNYGDTLTSIAQSNYSSEYKDVEDLISEIKKINHIYGDTIYAGDKLIVPYYVH